MSDHRIMDAYERSVCQECGQPRNAEAEVERLRAERDAYRDALTDIANLPPQKNRDESWRRIAATAFAKRPSTSGEQA